MVCRPETASTFNIVSTGACFGVQQRTPVTKCTSCPAFVLLQTFDLKGAAAIAKGGKNQREHIQAVIELTVPTDKANEARFKQHYKDFVGIDSTDRAKLTFKPLGEVRHSATC